MKETFIAYNKKISYSSIADTQKFKKETLMKHLRLFVFSLVIVSLLSSVITTPSYAWTDSNKTTVTAPLVSNRSFEPAFDDINSNNAKLTGICWACIWSKAKSMAARSLPSLAIKTYLKSQGYVCLPLLPWWLCSKPVYSN